VFGGTAPASLSLLATAKKSGFETAVLVVAAGPFFQVKALSSQGEVIGVSKISKVP
jgi:hypothetical protein